MAETRLRQTVCDKLPQELDIQPAPAALDFLTLKFELFRRLFQWYQPNLRRCDWSPVATFADYLKFGHALGTSVTEPTGLKYLSALLKLNDALLSRMDESHMQQFGRAQVDLLRLERDLIRHWGEQLG